MGERKPIRRKEFMADGCNYLTFLVYEVHDEYRILYGITDKIETHVKMHEEAKEAGLVNSEPIGGGIFSLKHRGVYERGSFYYGSPPDETIRYLERVIPKIVDC